MKTNNLDLLIKNPVTERKEIFNIKEMINDNFVKIDSAYGDMEREINENKSKSHVHENQNELNQINQNFINNVNDNGEKILSHSKECISGQEGIHGLRIKNNELQYLNEDDWVHINSGKLIPPPIENMSVVGANQTLIIKWSDPEDVIYQKIDLFKWEKTIVVIKRGSEPISIVDGDFFVENLERNKYSEVGYKLSGLENGVEYFVKPFVISTIKSINMSSLTIPKVPVIASSNFSENSWETIVTVAELKRGEEFWKIGDEKEMTMKSGKKVVFQILDFNHDELSDDSGRANITFGCKEIYKKGGKSVSGIKSNIIDEVSTHIKNVKKNTKTFRNFYSGTADLFLFAWSELTPGSSDEGSNYPLFSDEASRSKGDDYWIRTGTSYWDSGEREVCSSNAVVTRSGELFSMRGSDSGIIFGFCI